MNRHWVILVALLLVTRPAYSHDLAETSAAVVVRDGGHVELSFEDA